MTNKLCLTVHEGRSQFLTLPLDQYVLTFDDGLYSQYVFYQEIKHVPTPKIFFISSGIICNGAQSTEFPVCSEAHKKAFQGNYEDYMTVAQIKELMLDPWVTIGAHSHSHTRLNLFDSLAAKAKHIQEDTVQLLAWFESTLGFKPKDFCFPYNEDLDGLYKGLLKKQGFVNFYGRERIPIETLLHSYNPLDNRDALLA